jgi:hypothetical protein
MLNAIPRSWFSWDFQVMDGPRQVAEMDMTFWRRKAALAVEGVPYMAYRENALSGAFILEDPGGAVVAKAEKPSGLLRSFVVEHAGRRMTLKARSSVGRAFSLEDGQAEIGSVAPDHPLTRRATARLPEDLPLPVRIFVLWLVFVLWRREADSGGTPA